ncbi:MAG: hypothetical protein ACRD3Q_02250 [Terriglobales bacterium]
MDAMDSELQLTITLPGSAWAVIVAHLQAGTYQTVAATIANIAAQATPQIDAATARLAAAQPAVAREPIESVTDLARIH